MSLSESELCAIIDREINDSISGISTESEGETADIIDQYYGRPYGTEVEGLSQVVTRDIMETIEWLMPSVLKPFVSGSETVVFNPTSQEDEAQAEQETDYINHIVLKENNGFLFYHNWFKDAFLQKNGYAKVYVEEVEKTEVQTYSGLSDQAFNEVVSQDNIEPLEHSERQAEVEQMTPQGPVMVPVLLHDIKVRVTTKEKRFRLENIPQEEIKISRRTRDICLDNAPMVTHERIVTQSDLLEMGFDLNVIKTLPSYTDTDGELDVARSQYESENYKSYLDDSMREILLQEVYIRVDFDGDGKAELRKVYKAGNVILENEEEDFIPIEAITPIIMPHKHTGVSSIDPIEDIQQIRTELIRQILNNLYLTNSPEKEVVEDDVTMEDVLETRVGGVKRVEKVGSINPLVVPFTAGASLPFLDILDQMSEKRSGVSRHTQGLDADVLAQSTKGAFMGALEQANQRIEMVARTFAETGVKGIFRKLHQLVIKHQDQVKVTKLRNKWVPINPLEWKDRESMTVQVGVGTGNKQELIARLFAIAEEQKQALGAKLPIVTPQHLYKTYTEIMKKSDMENAEAYWLDPSSIPPQQPGPPPPNPLVEAEKVKGQFKLQSDQLAAQVKMMLKQQEDQHKREKEMLELRMKSIEADKDRQSAELIEAAKLEIKAMIEGFKIDIGIPGIGGGFNQGNG